MIQLDLNKWIQPKTKQYNRNTTEIYRTVKKWDYIPTPQCLMDTFNLSYSAAWNIFNSLLEEEARRTHGWKNNERIFRYIQERVAHTRSVLKKHLLQKHAEQVLSELKTWFPPIRRRPF